MEDDHFYGRETIEVESRESKPKRNYFTDEQKEEIARVASNKNKQERELLAQTYSVHISTINQWVREREKLQDLVKKSVEDNAAKFKKLLEEKDIEINSLLKEIECLKKFNKYFMDHLKESQS